MSGRSRESGRVRRWAWRTSRTARTWTARIDPRPRLTPTLLLVGAQRAGTTTLHHLLAQHPDLAPPTTTKGVHWFDVDWGRPRSWYLAHFPPAGSGPQVAFESSPYYLFHPEVPARAAAALSGLRAVAILRDPVSRAWSHYHHEVARGFETLPFDEALVREPVRLADAERSLARGSDVDVHHRHHAYLARGRYAEQVERWWDAIGAERLLILETSELAADPQGVVDRVARFVGVTPMPVSSVVRHNERRYPALDGDLRAELAGRFEADDRRLRELTGRTFSWMST